MEIHGPDRFTIKIDATAKPPFTIIDARGGTKFTGLATGRFPKLYVVTAGSIPIYVGITRQSMRNRLRMGWTADGKNGYHGYKWRHHHDEATLDLWYHVDAPKENPDLDIETVEAELVFLIRQHGQWPEFQTEIHFHPSDEQHRAVANLIWTHYRPA